MLAETRTFNGVTYYRYPNDKRKSDRLYFKRQGKYLHRVIWEAHNGPIPPAHHIHHLDSDPGNNDIANLECIAACDHISTYHADLTPERIAFFNRFCRPMATHWHQSAEGAEWHRQHAQEQYAALEPVERTCEHCGSTYTVKWNRVLDRFCSNRCKTAARYASGVDNEDRVCPQCGGTFTVNKYSKQRFCSRSCAQRSRRG